MFANIIVDITHEKLDKIFQYRVPSRLAGELSVGMEVFVPFGKWNRQTKGYVVGFSETCDYDLSKVKEIADISRDGIAIKLKSGSGCCLTRTRGRKSLTIIWKKIRKPAHGFWRRFWMNRCWNMNW